MSQIKPGDELLDLLKLLQDRLKMSGLERTVGLRDNMGTDCEFYSKSLDLFLRKDYQDLKNLIGNLNKKFEEIG